MDWLHIPLRRAFDFSGRSDRIEFWVYTVLTTLILLVVEAIELSLWGVPVLFCLLCLFLLIPSLSLTVRRLHDMGRSGWYVLLCFGVVTGIIVLIYCLGPSQPGTNQYGLNPKDKGKKSAEPSQVQSSRQESNTIQTASNMKQKTLGLVCDSCGMEQKPGSKFCAHCGSSLKA